MIENEFVKALEIENRREEAEFKDLLNDFEFVKELNREMADKYADLLNAFPKSNEIQLIIDAVSKGQFGMTPEDQAQRIFQLKRFKSACVALEKQDPSVKPPRYDELDNE